MSPGSSWRPRCRGLSPSAGRRSSQKRRGKLARYEHQAAARYGGAAVGIAVGVIRAERAVDLGTKRFSEHSSALFGPDSGEEDR